MTITQQEYEDALSELIFQTSDGEFNWAECLSFGKDIAVLIDKYLDEHRKLDARSVPS